MLQPTLFDLACLWNGTWNVNVTALPTCEPIGCVSPPIDLEDKSGATLSYRLIINGNMSLTRNISLFGTTFKMECPENQYFINRIPAFEAVCQHDG